MAVMTFSMAASPPRAGLSYSRGGGAPVTTAGPPLQSPHAGAALPPPPLLGVPRPRPLPGGGRDAAGGARGSEARRGAGAPVAPRAPAGLHPGAQRQRGGRPGGAGVAGGTGDRGRGVRPRRAGHLSRAGAARRLPGRQPEPGPARRAALRARAPGGADPHPRRLRRRRSGARRAGVRRRLGRRRQDRLDRRPPVALDHHPRLRAQRRDRPLPLRRHHPLRPARRRHDLDRAIDRRAADARRGRRGLRAPLRRGLRPRGRGRRACHARRRRAMTGQPRVAVGLNAVIVAVTEEVPRILTLRAGRAGGDGRAEEALPFGPLDPEHDRTLDRGLRRWVHEQTGLSLGYVEQLYTFGDRDRDPRARRRGLRVVSVAYLALVREVSVGVEAHWRDWYEFFPWEDWRGGRPPLIDAAIAPALAAWVDGAPEAHARQERRERADITFGLGGSSWDGERV